MEKIKFNEVSFSRKPITALILICAGLFPVLGIFELIDFMSEDTIKLVTVACSLGLAFHGLRQFFYRNYVQWNKRGINIRVNNFWGLNFSFSDVKHVNFAEDRYTLQMYGGRTKNIDLSGIEQKSKEQLLQLLKVNIQ
jgi:hypothetical protein